VIHKSYVLKGKDAEEASEALVRRIDALAAAGRAKLGAVFEYAGNESSRTLLTWDWEEKPKARARIQLSEQLPRGGKYILISCGTEKRCDQLARALADEFSFFTVEELVEKARGCEDADAYWIGLMGVGANQKLDGGVREVIEARLRSPSLACRDAAVQAATFVHQPELLPALRAARAAETDPDVYFLIDFAMQVSSQSPARR
jgi:hypothetical protein